MYSINKVPDQGKRNICSQIFPCGEAFARGLCMEHHDPRNERLNGTTDSDLRCSSKSCMLRQKMLL